MTATSTGWVASTYAGGFNTHIVAADATSTFTTPGSDLAIKTYRDDKILWSRVEVSSGNYSGFTSNADLIKIEAVIDAMALIGVRPIVIVGVCGGANGTNPILSHPLPWTNPATPPLEYQQYLTTVVNRLGARCNDYDIFNEPNFGYTTPGTGRLTEQQYAWMLQNSFTTIKTANPNANVWCNMLDPNTYAVYRDALISASGFDYVDGFLLHAYEGGGASSLTKTAEYVRAKVRNSLGAVRATYPSMRFAIGECSWDTVSVSQDLAGRNLARQAFMFRAIGVEIHNVYSCYEGGDNLALYSGVGVRKLAANYYANSIAICQDATAAKYYQDVPVHQVSLLRSNGNRNLALWGNTSGEPTVSDTAASTDASGTKSVWVKNTQGPGTLISTSMENGSTTSQTLNPGTQQYSVAYSPIAVVLSSTNLIQFPECPV